jgi:TolB-like protein/Tfp pilus assembly protein PilF
MSDPGPRANWLIEFRRRGVLRVAASYGAIAWLLVQIGGTVAEPMGWPAWILKALIWAALLGFPIACALAWFLEFTPQGIEVDHEAAGATRPGTRGLRRYADVLIIAILVVVVGVLVAREPGVVGMRTKPTVAVLPFKSLDASAEGNVLAAGIAGSVLHQLSNLRELDVISRTSSFALADDKGGASDIGERLKATYLLEGSVQSDRRRMRITTQLIDTRTGADVWSMRFDRRPSDVFAVQDEIALQVTRALELVLDARSIEHMQGQGTQDLPAYLAYLQGRALLATSRVSDVAQSLEPLRRAVQLDPKFANAYVALAEATLFVAEYGLSEDREVRFRTALEEGERLATKALQLEPDNGNAYLLRASIVAYTDLDQAEQDYRRGLQLNPNSAKGYAGLATLVYEHPERRQEALELLQHARRLDPLHPGYGVTLAVYQLYELGDVRATNRTLQEVLQQSPDYVPALTRLMEVRSNCLGELASAVEVGERALELDPGSEETRRSLAATYLDLGEDTIAEQVIDEAPDDLPWRRLGLLLYRHDVIGAGEAAYESIEQGLTAPKERVLIDLALRLHARVTHDYERARLALESLASIEWAPDGQPHLDPRPGLRDVEIALADILLLSGQEARGQALLNAVIARYRYEVEHDGRSEYWFRSSFPIAFVLAGDRARALGMLEARFEDHLIPGEWWFPSDLDPTLATLRDEPRYQALLERLKSNIASQHRRYEKLVADGRVPDRRAMIRKQ